MTAIHTNSMTSSHSRGATEQSIVSAPETHRRHVRHLGSEGRQFSEVAPTQRQFSEYLARMHTTDEDGDDLASALVTQESKPPTPSDEAAAGSMKGADASPDRGVLSRTKHLLRKMDAFGGQDV